MSSLHKSEKIDKSERIVFRCRPAIKRAVRIAAAERSKSVEDVLDEILSRALDVPADLPLECNEQPKTSAA